MSQVRILSPAPIQKGNTMIQYNVVYDGKTLISQVFEKPQNLSDLKDWMYLYAAESGLDREHDFDPSALDLTATIELSLEDIEFSDKPADYINGIEILGEEAYSKLYPT